MRKYISVIIPVLNEETLINELITRVTVNINKISDSYEIIIIDDGSIDDTWNNIEVVAKKDPKIKAIRFSRNFGQHYAISAGLKESNSEWVIVMDGDLQDRPEVFTDLYVEAKKGYDIVFVSRTERPEGKIYQLLQRIFYIILKTMSGINFDSSQANFSIINNKVVTAFNQFPEQTRFYGSTIKWLGFNRSSIKAQHGLRHSGRPSYNLKKRFKLAFDIIFSFSDKPLNFIIKTGLFFSIMSILISLILIYRLIIYGFSVEGWASVILSIFFFGGIVLVFMGVLGIYIGRIFNEVKNRPLYVISESVNIYK